VVSTAILWMTYKIKFEEIANNFFSNNISLDQDTVELKFAESVVTYKDIKNGQNLPQNGEKILLDVRIFFNGLEIKRFNGGMTSYEVIFGDLESLSAPFLFLLLTATDKRGSERGSAEKSKIEQILSGMRKGGRRKVLLPPELAFGDSGFSPLVPPNSPIVMDIIITDIRE
jgi:hypothetical protein